MKRTVFIVAGVVIVLLLVSIWMYILISGTTSDTVTFNDLDFANSDTQAVIPTTVNQEPTIDTAEAERLQQLTTKPVVGFTEVRLSSTSPRTINYIEAGTGHIFSINLSTGEEKRVSATTIPLTTKGALTPNGRHVLLRSDTGPRASYTIGTLSTSSDQLSNFTLRENIIDFTATTDNEFLFTTPADNQLVVSVYRPDDNTIDRLFTIPFREAAISWHHTTAGPHTVYPKASSRLEGYVYTFTNGIITRTAASGFGVSAIGSTASVIFSNQSNSEYSSFIVASDSVVPKTAPINVIPEKCQFTVTDPTIALCATELREFSHLMPDPWYQGTLITNDSIWEFNTDRQSSRLLLSPERTTGRQIDLINPIFGNDDRNLYFQNKTDNTLWVYKYISIAPNNS